MLLFAVASFLGGGRIPPSPPRPVAVIAPARPAVVHRHQLQPRHLVVTSTTAPRRTAGERPCSAGNQIGWSPNC